MSKNKMPHRCHEIIFIHELCETQQELCHLGGDRSRPPMFSVRVGARVRVDVTTLLVVGVTLLARRLDVVVAGLDLFALGLEHYTHPLGDRSGSSRLGSPVYE